MRTRSLNRRSGLAVGGTEAGKPPGRERTNMRIIGTVVLGVVSLSLGACCFGGGGGKSSGGSTQAASTSRMKMADPAKIKEVKKVAVISINAECDIKNETEKGAWGAMGAVSAMKNQEATRTPATLDLAAPAFAKQLDESTDWEVLPLETMTANPAYAEKTFSADLREQVRETRKALGCAGGGYRVITKDYTDRAGELATALGVDAVVIAQFVMILKYDTKGANATGTLWTNGNITVVGQDGSVLFKDMMTTRSDDSMPMPVGKLDWTKVPPLGVSALQNAAKKLAEDVKKATST